MVKWKTPPLHETQDRGVVVRWETRLEFCEGGVPVSW